MRDKEWWVMAKSYWRNKAAPIIAEVIERVGKDDMKALRKALKEAYPFGERKYHPYKVWLDEIKKQLAPPVEPVEIETPLFD